MPDLQSGNVIVFDEYLYFGKKLCYAIIPMIAKSLCYYSGIFSWNGIWHAEWL